MNVGHLKITEPFYLKLIYDKDDMNKKFKAFKKDESLDLDNEVDELKEILNKLDDNVLKINDKDYSSFFQLGNKIFINIPFKLIFLDENLNPIEFSGGENTIIFYLERIAYLLQQVDKIEPIILLFDEIELYLHPSWQRKILRIILDIISISEYKFQIIIASHSPFIISDIPKRNIIFLKNGQTDKGINHKQTFGANIHTLLSDSFFMEDGLMGEFAKSKITEIKKFYEKVEKENKTDKNIECYNKNKDRFWQIQKIIGEPFLQKIVKNQLEEIELILLGRDEAIDKEIARLQALKASSKNA
jgi:hypothetical protein